MPTEDPALLLTYPAKFSDDVLRRFVETVETDGVSLKVDREERGPYAGVEWLLPTVAVVYVMKSYFDGFLKEAGKDHYQALKTGLPRLWAYLSTRQITVVASAPGKLAPHDRYSRALSIMARGQRGTIKLLLATDATEEEVAAATDAYLRLLESLYVGQPVHVAFPRRCSNRGLRPRVELPSGGRPQDGVSKPAG